MAERHALMKWQGFTGDCLVCDDIDECDELNTFGGNVL